MPRSMISLVLHLLIGTLSHTALAQTSASVPVWTTISPEDLLLLETSMVNSMLKIVDRKFDTLSERLTSIERAFSNIQVLQVRHYRGLHSALQGLSSTFQTITTQLTQNSREAQATKATCSDLAQNVQDVRTLVDQRMDSLERGMTSINESFYQKSEIIDDIRKRSDEIYFLVDHSFESLTGNISKSAHDVVSKMAEMVAIVNMNIDEEAEDLRFTVDQKVPEKCEDAQATKLPPHEVPQALTSSLGYVPLPPACPVNVTAIESVMDARFAAYTRHSDARLAVRFSNLQERIDIQFHSRFKELYEVTEAQFQKLANRTLKSETFSCAENVSAGIDDVTTQADEAVRSARPPETPRAEVPGDVDGFFRSLLTNLTMNVIHAISYFRHTGDLMERILSNSETATAEQIRVRKLLEGSRVFQNYPDTNQSDSNAEPFSENPLVTSQTNDILDDSQVSNELPNIADNRVVQHRDTRFPPRSDNSEGQSLCKLAPGVLGEIGSLISNGSQLLDLLADLLQVTTASLTNSTRELKNELIKISETRNQIIDILFSNTSLVVGRDQADKGSKQEKEPLGAGSTSTLQGLANTTRAIFNIAEAIASNTGWIPYIFHNVQFVEGQINRTISLDQRLISDLQLISDKVSEAASRKEPCPVETSSDSNVIVPDASLSPESSVLNSVYDVTVKLDRIMPALTRLVAEPELVTLVDGKTPIEGRVEIFYKGHWGTLCDARLGHADADLLCRQAGHVGGISAGRGSFGPGSGVIWNFNQSCVFDFQCHFVNQADETMSCSHETDFGVICDHMVRLEALNDNNDVSTGRVQVHHQGRWRSVCAATWDVQEARVACRQLGYQTGRPVNGGRQPVETTGTFLSGVKCHGDETIVHGCQSNAWLVTSCQGNRHAAVTCQ